MEDHRVKSIWKSLLGEGGFVSRSEMDTLAVGKSFGTLARQALDGSTKSQMFPVLLLEGEMGAGKTVLVRGIAEGMGLDPAAVQSPTFTLVNEYSDSAGTVRLVHCDLYRLEPEEVEGTGLLDLVGAGEALVVVEWADRLPMSLPDAGTVSLSRISGAGHENWRRIERIALAEDALGG